MKMPVIISSNRHAEVGEYSSRAGPSSAGQFTIGGQNEFSLQTAASLVQKRPSRHDPSHLMTFSVKAIENFECFDSRSTISEDNT